jgi:hypothetical protein
VQPREKSATPKTSAIGIPEKRKPPIGRGAEIFGGNGERVRGCERVKKEVFQVQACEGGKILTAVNDDM